MKKILVLLLVMSMLLLVGCSGDNKPADDDSTAPTTTTTAASTTTTTTTQKEKSKLCGEWTTEFELLDTHELLTLVLNLNEDGTAEYKYGYYLSEVAESFEGTWSEKDGKLCLNLYGGPFYMGEETPEDELYELKCVYRFELEETGLSLKYDEGGALVYGSEGREIFLKPAE